MTLKTDIGVYDFVQASAVSAIQWTPPADREVEVARIFIDNPSANDTWIVSVNTREIFRAPVNTTGNQQLFGTSFGAFPKQRDLFKWYEWMFNDRLLIPVPQGMVMSINSLAGATANVRVSGHDLTPGSQQTTARNHFAGKSFRVPMFGYVNASVAAAGEIALDTAIKPIWCPNIFSTQIFPYNWEVDVVALWLEALGVNTFSGSANHTSVTDHVTLVQNGTRMFSHIIPGQVSGGLAGLTTVPAGQFVSPEGIPNVGAPSNAGSANTKYGDGANPFPAFQVMALELQNVLDYPIRFRGGDEIQWYLGVTGDLTGGANYAGAIIAVLCDVRQLS